MSPAEDPTASPTPGQPPVPQPAPAGDPAPNILPTVRASDSDRNAVAERLRDAFADGRLDEAEFDARIQRSLTARTRQDLDGLVGDLGDATPLPQPPAAQTHPVDPAARNLPNYGFSVAVMGGVERKGRWRVPAETTVVAVMGGACLDLRAATLTSQVTTIRAAAIMGGIEIVVPPGVRVEVNGLPLMGGGGRDKTVDDADLPSTAPLIRVQYLALMGGVGVTARGTADRTDDHLQRMEHRTDAHRRRMEQRRDAQMRRIQARRDRHEHRMQHRMQRREPDRDD